MKHLFAILVFFGFWNAKAQSQFVTYEKDFSGRNITFLKKAVGTAEDFSASDYKQKPDPALLQNEYRLNNLQRQAIKPEDFQKLTQEEIDQIYIRLSSGSIQPGKYKGLVVQKGELIQKAKKIMLSKFSDIANFGRHFCGSNESKDQIKDQDFVECLAEMAWKGKQIYEPDRQTGEVKLLNAISKKVGVALKIALVPFFKGLDPKNWLWRTTDDFFGESKFMLFPAQVYCGQSLFDHRRESILIDYAWGREVSSNFIKKIEEIAGRGFLNIRDEIRMVRPGLYLGRAYSNKIFLLNFVLYNPEADNKYQKDSEWPKNACFDGTTTR